MSSQGDSSVTNVTRSILVRVLFSPLHGKIVTGVRLNIPFNVSLSLSVSTFSLSHSLSQKKDRPLGHSTFTPVPFPRLSSSYLRPSYSGQKDRNYDVLMSFLKVSTVIKSIFVYFLFLRNFFLFIHFFPLCLPTVVTFFGPDSMF